MTKKTWSLWTNLPPNDQPPYPMRLQKFLSRCGAASRRGSENLMTAGRVTVNGEVATELGRKVNPATDIVCLDGKRLSLNDGHIYIMLNKPAGYLTTMDDPQGRPCVRELILLDKYPGLFPVGRLDYDTTGLLLFMTDGELAHKLLHPKHQVAKRYLAVVEGEFKEGEAEQLRRGVVLTDGPTAPAKIEIIAASKKLLGLREMRRLQRDEGFSAYKTEVWCTICEGRKRQVKRMFAHVGHPVIELKREALGPLLLGDLAVGSYRELDENEVSALKNLS